MKVEWKWTRRTRSDGHGVWKGASQGADKGETRGKRARGKSYHDARLPKKGLKSVMVTCDENLSQFMTHTGLNGDCNVILLQRASLNATSTQMLMQYHAWLMFEKGGCNQFILILKYYYKSS